MTLALERLLWDFVTMVWPCPISKENITPYARSAAIDVRGFLQIIIYFLNRLETSRASKQHWLHICWTPKFFFSFHFLNHNLNVGVNEDNFAFSFPGIMPIHLLFWSMFGFDPADKLMYLWASV